MRYSLVHFLFADLILLQLNKEIQQLHMPLRKLKIGTYVNALPVEDRPEGYNPFSPIATATLTTPVFDVVHMFSERSISAVPIIDEEGVVVNLYETVDVIVGTSPLSSEYISDFSVDTRTPWRLSVSRPHNLGST